MYNVTVMTDRETSKRLSSKLSDTLHVINMDIDEKEALIPPPDHHSKEPTREQWWAHNNFFMDNLANGKNETIIKLLKDCQFDGAISEIFLTY